MNALEAEGLNTFYGKSRILHDVGLAVAEGRITTLLGAEARAAGRKMHGGGVPRVRRSRNWRKATTSGRAIILRLAW